MARQLQTSIALLKIPIYFYLFKDIYKDDYIAQTNHIVRQRIKRDSIPNTASIHHIQMHIT